METKPSKIPKFNVMNKVSSTGFGGSSDVGIIIGIKWMHHNRLSKWTWGYKVDWENQGPGFAGEYIPECYFESQEEMSKKKIATATLRIGMFALLLKELNESDLAKFTVVKAKQLDGGDYWQVTLETEEVSAFLLESSLKDGMLREWKKEFSFF